MTNPYFRLLFISVNVLLWSALIIFGLRQLGNQQSYTQYKHPLLLSKNIYIFQSTKAENLSQDIEIINKNDNWVPYIDIEYRGDYWHVIKVLSKKPYKSKSFGSVKGYLSNLKSNSLAINIKNKQLYMFAELSNELNAYPDLSIIMTSETNAIGREVRNKQPKWIHMSSHSLTSRLQLMGALFLETITQIDADIIALLQVDELSGRILKEVLKRKKLLAIDLDTAKTTDLPKHFNIYISSDLDQLKSIESMNKK